MAFRSDSAKRAPPSEQPMLIAAETPDRIAAIHALNRAAFPTDAEARLVDQLRRDGDLSLSLVALIDGAVVGHVGLSPMSAPFPAMALAPVAVDARARRRGVAAALIRDGLDRAARAGAAGVFVVGDVAYYGRFGFAACLASGFINLYAGPHLMAIALAPAGLPVSRGEIDFAPAFASLS
jgi:putative acetyltransferase